MKAAAVVLLLVPLFISACGGGGGGGGGGGITLKLKFDSKFTIEYPAAGGSTYYTSDDSISLAGDAFHWPSNANCIAIQPQPIDITWKNKANGLTGGDQSSASCLCDFFACVPWSRWRISQGTIPLEMGNNKIKVTGRASGKSQSASITIVREEGPVSINFTNIPGDLTMGDMYSLQVQVKDGTSTPMPDQVIDWSSSDNLLASVTTSNLPTDQRGNASAEVTALAAGTVGITARIAGTDVSSTTELEVIPPLPPPFDPNPPGDELPDQPTLLTPENNATISQERPEPACGENAEYDFGYEIYFDWTDVAATHGVAGYHLFVRASGAKNPIVDEFIPSSEFTKLGCGSYIIDSNVANWKWWVQAEDSRGSVGPASPEGLFSFAPCRQDDDSRCQDRQ
jgi:hypothetical protein